MKIKSLGQPKQNNSPVIEKLPDWPQTFPKKYSTVEGKIENENTYKITNIRKYENIVFVYKLSHKHKDQSPNYCLHHHST